MKRRELLGALDRAVVAWPLTAHAQQPTTERMRGRVLVAGLMVLLCLMGLGFIGPGPSHRKACRSIAGAWRWTRLR